VLDETTHADDIGKTPAEPVEDDGWIRTSRGKEELRRVPYLAKLRNLVLEPLEEMAREEGEVFERVVWLNDVVFTVCTTDSLPICFSFFQTQDVQRLLDTRGGDYAAACSLDFSKPPAFYDTFALRDSDGHAAIMQSWPYFRSKASRDALKASEPVPVTSCWNGMGSYNIHTPPEALTFTTQLEDTNILEPNASRNGRRPILHNPKLHPPPIPRHTRLPRNPPPRRLRVLPDPHRQLAISPAGRLAEPQRPCRLRLPRV
jgi:hypothetical protein